MFKSLIKGYAYDTAHDIFLSVFPGFKYHIAAGMLMFSAWIGVLALLTGMSASTMVAFWVAALLELITGIIASVGVNKQPFESGKLGRWFFKIVIMLFGLYLLHQFSLQFDSDSLVNDTFKWSYNMLFMQGALEFIISILENYAVITGKPKDYYVAGIQQKLYEALTPNK